MEFPEPTFQVEKYRWLRQRAKLDLLYIDEDIQELPVLLQEAGEITATAIEIRETLKNDLDIQEAVVANNLRQATDEKGKSKSETTIASMIALDSKYQQIQKDLSIARLDAGLWQNIMETIRSKSSLVRASADLIQAGFISTTYYLDKRKKDIRGSAS